MTIRLLSFTDRGEILAKRLAEGLNGEASRCGAGCSLSGWTAGAFSSADGLIFVGAAGIAVRAIAPYVRSKTSDPAVVVTDETGRYAIPILSGHLGGANDLARRIAALTGGEAVITTATDVSGTFPVDVWAVVQNCAILEPERIKTISARMLSGEPVGVESDFPISGQIPMGLVPGAADGFTVSFYRKHDERLHLVPRILVLGVGCRKGTSVETLEEAASDLLLNARLCSEGVVKVCTIDRKGQEPGLLAFCADRGWPLVTFSPEELAEVPGTFTASDFVAYTTGVDNVCERAAVLGSGGSILIPKQAGNGITLAVAAAPYHPKWRWQDV